jgi:hypothetical protein
LEGPTGGREPGVRSRDGEGCEAAASASPAFEAALLERSRLLRRVARTSAEKAAVALSLCPCRLLKCSSARASSICAAGDPAHPPCYQNPLFLVEEPNSVSESEQIDFRLALHPNLCHHKDWARRLLPSSILEPALVRRDLHFLD